MRLQIRDGDEAGFNDVRDWLLDGFYDWLGSEWQLDEDPSEQMASDAELMLDWKFGYDDGHLGRWTIGDVTEFLLRWCPRKLSVNQEDCIRITASVAAFTDYLADQRLLARGSSPASALRAAALGATGEFMAEAGSGSSRPAGVGLMSAPPVVLPPEEDIEESRASAPVLAMFAKLVEFITTGRQLTEEGNLSLSDSRELANSLGVGLPMVNFVFTWAVEAGAVILQRGRALVTEGGLALADDPASMFDSALDALLEIGPVTGQRDPDAPTDWPEIDRVVDGMVMLIILRPYAERGPVPLAELAETTALTLLELCDFDNWSDEAVTAHVRSMVIAMMDALELAGVVQRVNVINGDPDQAAGDLGEIELTAAGVPAVRRLMVNSGMDVPVAGRLAGASGPELLTGLEPGNTISVMAEFEVWRRRRSPEQALAELAEAVRQLDDVALQNLALGLMSEFGTDAAEPYVRGLVGEGPAVRAFARCWLADHGQVDPNELYDPADLDPFVYVLAHRLVTQESDGLLACLALAGDDSAQARLVGGLSTRAMPMIKPLLETIGRTHPAKPVAKAARKALFQLKSRLASQVG